MTSVLRWQIQFRGSYMKSLLPASLPTLPFWQESSPTPIGYSLWRGRKGRFLDFKKTGYIKTRGVCWIFQEHWQTFILQAGDWKSFSWTNWPAKGKDLKILIPGVVHQMAQPDQHTVKFQIDKSHSSAKSFYFAFQSPLLT